MSNNNEEQAQHEPSDEQPYEPIACSGHDQLLAFATLRKQCRLTVNTEDGGVRDVQGVIEDVYTRTGAEYLRLRDGSVFRLDRIVALDGRPMPTE